MRYAKDGRTYWLRLEPGEEIVETVARFARAMQIDGGSVAGIGSAHDVELGYFDRYRKEYTRQRFDGDMELTSLTGTIALKQGKPYPHLHATFGTRDFGAVTGHLFEGTTAATCEIVIRQAEAVLRRTEEPTSGLWLLDLQAKQE